MADFDVFSLESYHYILPEELIAQHPPEVRGTSRLMVLNRHGDGVCPIDAVFDNLPEFLPENALLVVNNSRVVPARLFGSRPRGGKAEMLLLTPPVLLEKSARICTDNADDATIRFEAEAEALLKPGRNIREKDTLDFGELQADVLKKKGLRQTHTAPCLERKPDGHPGAGQQIAPAAVYQARAGGG